MPARSTRITLRNRTQSTLTLTDSGLDHGGWTAGGWTPPGTIPPGETLAWQSESDGLGTGTEGHVDYAVSGSRELLHIYWDNPFVGLNRYQQDIGPGFGISFSGGKGPNAEVIYTLQPDTAVYVPSFLPSANGFPFSNTDWPSEPDDYLPLPPFPGWPDKIGIGNASNGLCGGMAFAARDYFDAGQWPAQFMPTGPGDPVFDYIARRLFDSFNSPLFGSCDPVPCGGYDVLANVMDFSTQMSPTYPDADSLVADGRAWIMAHEAWPQIQATIDGGEPSPIGLVMVKSLLPTDLGENHQVLAYGYQLKQQQLTLHIYDPNAPLDDGIQASLGISETDNAITVTHNVNAPGPIYSFFTLRYERMPTVGGSTRSAGWSVARTPDHLDVFWVNPDGSIGSTWWDQDADGGAWDPARVFAATGPDVAQGGTVAVVARTPDHLDVFWVNPDGSIGSTWWDQDADGGAWDPARVFAATGPDVRAGRHGRGGGQDSGSPGRVLG